MKDPAALLYIDKWLVSTKGMKASARGWYLNLILHQYDKGSLPNNIEDLADYADVKYSEFEEFKQVFEQVLKQKFVENEDGRLVNEFAMEIIRSRESFKEKRSESGKLSYVLKYIRKNHLQNKEFELFLKENINLDFDIKNEQMIEQVFKQIYELYINKDKDKIINTNSSNYTNAENQKNSNSKTSCKEKFELFEGTFFEEDLQNFLDHFKQVNITEQEIREAAHDFKLNKVTSENPEAPYTYKTYKEWFKKYLTENRAKYVHVPKMRIVSISESVSREDLHTAFKFYWMDEYTIEEIRERILSGEYKPKDGVPFDNLIKNKLIEVRND